MKVDQNYHFGLLQELDDKKIVCFSNHRSNMMILCVCLIVVNSYCSRGYNSLMMILCRMTLMNSDFISNFRFQLVAFVFFKHCQSLLECLISHTIGSQHTLYSQGTDFSYVPTIVIKEKHFVVWYATCFVNFLKMNFLASLCDCCDAMTE